MSRRLSVLSVGTLCLLFTASCCVAAEPEKLVTPLKNVIIVICDGMGFNSYRAASFYRSGALGKQALDSFPVHLSMMTSMQRKVGTPIPSDEIVYDAAAYWKSIAGATSASRNAATTDSAAAGTAMFTGTKTTNGRVAVDGSEEPQRLVSLAETAASRGMAVGSVTSVQASHATPASFASHNVSRDNYSEIFTEIYRESPLRVIAGAGDPFKLVGEPDGEKEFKYVGSAETWDEIVKASSQPRNLQSRHVRIAPARLSIPPVDGLSESAPSGADGELRKVYKIPEGVTFPTLAQWSTASLQVLQAQGGDKGFILMIEAGAIDWANHDRKINRCVWETTSMFKMIEAVVAWVEKNSSWDETLLIVTADHETGAIWGPGTYEDVNNNGVFDKDKEKNTEDKFVKFVPIIGRGAGKIPEAQYGSGSHSNALVPLWVRGVGADRIRSYIRTSDAEAARVWDFSGEAIDNTDLARFVRDCWGE